MYKNIKIKADKNDSNKRLDCFIKEKFPNVSRSNIKKALAEGKIFLNGNIGKKGDFIKEGDEIHILELIPKDIEYIPNNKVKGIKILFQDNFIVLFYKPPFMHVLPHSSQEKDTLANFAISLFIDEIKYNLSPPLFLSRLDYETSGIILMAKDKETYKYLLSSQEKGEIIKTYSLIVKGDVKEEVVIKNKIITTGRGKVKVDKDNYSESEHYHTRFILEKKEGEFALLKAIIKKGRMHQIRAHASFAGFPILGDVKYNGEVLSIEKFPKRPLLHSTSIQFFHPKNGRLVIFDSPLPKDFKYILNSLFNNEIS